MDDMIGDETTTHHHTFVSCKICRPFSALCLLRLFVCLGFFCDEPCNLLIFVNTVSSVQFITSGFFYWHGLNSIPAWISTCNYIRYNVWDVITNPFPNFNGGTVEVWEWISNFIPPFTRHVITYPCWGKKLNHVSKSGPRLLFDCLYLREAIDKYDFCLIVLFLWIKCIVLGIKSMLIAIDSYSLIAP